MQMKTDITFEPLAHSPYRAAQRLGISLREIYAHIAAGELKSFKLGKRRLIPEAELQSFVNRRMEQAA